MEITLNPIQEGWWESIEEDRKKQHIQVPYLGKKFEKRLLGKGYSAATARDYINRLHKLDKFVVVSFQPMDDIFEELPLAFKIKDLNKVRQLCRQYESPIDTYMSFLKGGVEVGNTWADAEYEDIRKSRSVCIDIPNSCILSLELRKMIWKK